MIDFVNDYANSVGLEYKGVSLHDDEGTCYHRWDGELSMLCAFVKGDVVEYVVIRAQMRDSGHFAELIFGGEDAQIYGIPSEISLLLNVY